MHHQQDEAEVTTSVSKQLLTFLTLPGCFLIVLYGVATVSPKTVFFAMTTWISFTTAAALWVGNRSPKPVFLLTTTIVAGVFGAIGLSSCSDYGALDERDIMCVIRFVDKNTGESVPGVAAVLTRADGDEKQGVADETGRVFIRHKLRFEWRYRLFRSYGFPWLQGVSLRAKRDTEEQFRTWSLRDIDAVVSGGVTQDCLEPLLLYAVVRLDAPDDNPRSRTR